MMQPDLVSEFEFRGRHYDVRWYDVLTKEDIPDHNWQQAYVIGDHNGKVPIVIYPSDRDNLPGGKTEPGESLEQTLSREVQEEINMRVISWEPLGYQVCTCRETGDVSYQFRAYAKLERIGEFVNDPGGSITGHKLVAPEKVNSYIKYGKIGDRMMMTAKKYFTS